MKFEVSIMLPVHTTAVKRRLLKLLSSAWLLVYAVGFQLKDVIASTSIKEYDVIRHITDLREYSQVATVPEAVERYTNPIAIGYTNFRIL